MGNAEQRSAAKKQDGFSRWNLIVAGLGLAGAGFGGYEVGVMKGGQAPPLVAQAEREWEACFSPRGGCTDAIVAQIGRAEQSVFGQACFFDSERIANALKEKKREGKQVEIIVDRRAAMHGRNKARELSKGGVTVHLDGMHNQVSNGNESGWAHNKVFIIDERIVVTGSFNFTDAAENTNAENLIIVNNTGVAAKYKEDWNRHREHSIAYPINAIGPISPEEAANYVGTNQECIVEMKVADVYLPQGGSRIFLNKTIPYTDINNFVFLIEKSAKPAEFANMELYFRELTSKAQGKKVQATGKISVYKNRKQLVVTGANDLTICD